MHKAQKQKLLFITWDGPQTSYMEGLFMPIFEKITALTNIEFHVLQFTWANASKSAKIAALAKAMGIHYNACPIVRRPHPVIGSIISVLKGKAVIEKYVSKHKIDIVMPRSTFPAMMVNLITTKNFRLVFDADGLPLEERIDFGSLTESSQQYKFLKKQETSLLLAADKVLTRSKKAIYLHVKTVGEANRKKFAVVFNGRDEDQFKPSLGTRDKRRQELGFLTSEKVFVYCGSLGKQYGWEDMLTIFSRYLTKQPAHWLILTGDVTYVTERMPLHLKEKITVLTSSIEEVPAYLNTADVAFAIRQPLHSMQGVAPIKLGEYLLMGIPTIASEGIGDTDEILKDIPHCFKYTHEASNNQSEQLDEWLSNSQSMDRNAIRIKALSYFSLKAAANSYIKAIKNQ